MHWPGRPIINVRAGPSGPAGTCEGFAVRRTGLAGWRRGWGWAGPGIFLGAALGAAQGWAQAPKPDDDPNVVSNDQTTRPLQMPAASNEAKEAFEDFERFRRRGAWERATKALDAIPDAQLGRFVDGKDGFIIPVRRKRADVLAGLAPDGLAAYRLFHDAEAKKLLDEAEGATEQATLEKVATTFFQTASGDNAADRLGDLYFEAGRFDRAAECWQAIRRDRPDSELSPALLGVKAALALHRAGRPGPAQALRRELTDRHGGEVVAVGGRSAPVREHLDRLLGPASAVQAAPAAMPAAPSGSIPDRPLLARGAAPAWQVRFGASITAGMTPAEAVQWHDNALSVTVPAVAVAGTLAYANYLGYVFAVDLETGKLRWRSAPFHNLDVVAMAEQAAMADPTRFAVAASDRFVWSLGRDLKDANYQAVSSLTCRRAENGEVVWRSGDSADLGQLDLVGLPVLSADALLIAGKSSGGYSYNGMDSQPRQYVLALRPHDGKLLWKAEVAAFRESQRYYYYNMRDQAPQPRIAVHAGSVYVDTHQGVMVKLDAKTGAVEWGYGYPTEPMEGQSRILFVRAQAQDPAPVGAPPIAAGDALLVKGAKSDRIAVIDPDALAIRWQRTIAKSARPLALDDGTILLGGPDLGALDRKDRSLRWTLPLPPGSNAGRTLVAADGLWQFTTRGIFEVDPATGAVRRILRVDDDGGSGGDLILTDRWLLAVSDRTIAAFPRDAGPAARADGSGPAESKARGGE